MDPFSQHTAALKLEEEREAKQDYLRAEIVEGGYDPALFVQHCESLRGTDVDLWRFDELKACVELFKSQYKGLQQGKQKPSVSQPELLSDIHQDLIGPEER